MSTTHRLAAPLAARLVGSVLVVAAILVLVSTVLVALFQWEPAFVLVAGLLAVAAVAATTVAVRRRPLLRLDDAGYRVSWVRGTGVKAAAWTDVADAVTAAPSGIHCVVLRLKDGRTTSIPVAAVATDRDALVAELRERLRRGEGLRPLDG
ncbi:hypothetical protein [Nocardioides aestuarii]|uniref:PH domain-containing protein n=1 Tax=Nocardioides aestuarii TaxID=252231 RepID=A0ABW4TKI9_9ACTN